MIFGIWAIGAIITAYIFVQKDWYKVDEFVKREDSEWVNSFTFWKIVLNSTFWYIALPIRLIWWILDETLGRKFFKKSKNISENKAIAIINELLQRPDILTDATMNENTIYDAEYLYELGERYVKENPYLDKNFKEKPFKSK